MAPKKPKTIKNVTEIPNASVKIEVEEKEETATEEAIQDTNIKKGVEDVQNKTEEALDASEGSSGTSWKKIILMILIIVPVGFLTFGGLLFFTNDFNLDSLNKKSEKSIKLPQISSTPTKVEVDRKAHEIEVQNGSGIAGEGAKVKEILENEGFSVGAVGNADNSSYTETIITVGSEVSEEFIDELTKVLEERGAVGTIEKFATGEDGEVRVIVGSELKEEASPTP